MTLQELAPYLILIVAGFLPHEAWRWVGVMLAYGIDEKSEIIVWFRAIAVAILAAVVANILVFSPGALADVPLWLRLSAASIGMIAFFLARQSVLAAVTVGIGALVFGNLLIAQH